MPLEIKSRDDLIIVPTHILHNPGLGYENIFHLSEETEIHD